MAYKNSLITGITELLILTILNQEDSYVYKITKDISRLSEGLLDISINTIYTATYKLEEDHMISEYSKLVGKKRTRIYYHIERKGIEYLKKIIDDYSTMTKGVKNILDALGGNANE